MQMIPDTISDIFQPMNDFFYGLDVEIRPNWPPAQVHPGGPLLLSTRGGGIGTEGEQERATVSSLLHMVIGLKF